MTKVNPMMPNVSRIGESSVYNSLLHYSLDPCCFCLLNPKGVCFPPRKGCCQFDLAPEMRLCKNTFLLNPGINRKVAVRVLSLKDNNNRGLLKFIIVFPKLVQRHKNKKTEYSEFKSKSEKKRGYNSLLH